MKKLMFAAAALAAGVAMATDVTSANVVGYNTTDNTAEDSSFIFGASFSGLSTKGIVAFKDLASPQGFEDGDQIQTAFTDEAGLTQLYMYSYFSEWLDENYDPVADDAGIPLGGSAWFISAGDPKTITTSGEVEKQNFIHTFTESSALIASAFPTAFCPNSENVAWGVSDGAMIQTAFTDESGLTQLYMYSYFGEWLDENYDTVPADSAIAPAGTGFWIILADPSETFSEVSPIAD